MLGVVNLACASLRPDAAKLAEVKAIWARMPVHPGMQETNSSTSSGWGKVIMGKHFRSDVPYEEVKRFYTDRLVQDGWTLHEEKRLNGSGTDFGGYELEFRKGDIALTIEYAGKANYGWDYGMDVAWTRWVKK